MLVQFQKTYREYSFSSFTEARIFAWYFRGFIHDYNDKEIIVRI